MTAFEAAQDVAAKFMARDLEAIQREKWSSRSMSNRASGLDDPCERRLYYHRTDGDKAAPVSDDLQSIFLEGRLHERDVVKRLDNADLRLLREQSTEHWDAFRISGHIEGEIEHKGFVILGEIKSIHGALYDRVDSVSDLRDASGFLRKWYGQVQIYMLLRSREAGVIFIKSKQTGRVKALPVALDLEYAEGLLKKAERINAAFDKGEPPAFSETLDECRRCGYWGRVCNPPTESGEGATVILDPHLIEAARVWMETRHEASRFRDADNTLKKALVGKTLAVVGDVVAVSTTTERKGYTVEPGETTSVSIKPAIGRDDVEPSDRAPAAAERPKWEERVLRVLRAAGKEAGRGEKRIEFRVFEFSGQRPMIGRRIGGTPAAPDLVDVLPMEET
ncbi:MAG: hypothetical protein ABIE42_11730 [Candidatus Eisenbacteria bacterium]